VMNLIMNSIDAMKMCMDARVIIQVAAIRNEHRLVSVSDTGVGCPAAADQIFNVFLPQPDGTGMGLRYQPLHR